MNEECFFKATFGNDSFQIELSYAEANEQTLEEISNKFKNSWNTYKREIIFLYWYVVIVDNFIENTLKEMII